MAEKVRYNYIEPNHIVVDKRTDRDNEVWVMEDYNMSVDLQVIMSDRLKTFNLNRDNLAVSVKNSNRSPLGRYLSFMRGTKNPNGQGSSLTDSYINASYSELTRTGVSDPECLGISNVHINFAEQFYPQVSITFIDVRGYSLMMPSELAYARKLKGEKVDAELNFFSSLFQFPYPMFLLTVKGNYGDRVTFQLAVNEFHNTFNSETGNFEVTVDFIGFLYGLYTDIPTNFIIAAPYFGKSDTTSYCNYWQQKIDSGEFDFSDGGKILTFIEYVEALRNVNKNIVSETMSEIKTGQAALEERVAAIKDLQGLFNTAAKGIYRTNITFGDNYEYCLTSNRRYYLYIARVASEGNEPYVFLSDNVNAFDGKAENYNSKYNANISKMSGSLGDFVRIGTYEELINAVGGKGDLGEAVKNYETELKSLDLWGYFLYDSNTIGKEIDDEYKAVAENLDKYNEEHDAELQQEAKDQLSKALGFPPTVENIYRMIFAHIDCFLHLFYELIDDIETHKEGRKITDLKLSDLSHDVSGLGDKIDFMPPFPNVFRDNKAEDKPNELLWIGAEPEFAKFAEIKFVEDLFKAVISTKNKANDIFKQDLPINNNSDVTAPIFNYYPSLVTDVFYMQNNPFDFFETTAGQFENDYFGALLYYVALRMKGYYFSTLGTDADDTLKKLKLSAKLDAYNYVTRNKTCPNEIKRVLDGLNGDKAAAAKEIYDKFVSNHSKVLEDRILTHVKSIIKKDNDDDYETYGISREGGAAEDHFYAWMGSTISTPQAFSEAWLKPLPSAEETKIFDDEDRRVYENRSYCCKIDGQPTTSTCAYDYGDGEGTPPECRIFEKDKDEDINPQDYAKMCADEALNPSGNRYVKHAYYYKKDGLGQLVNMFLGKAYPSNSKDKLKMFALASMGSGTDMRFSTAKFSSMSLAKSRFYQTSLHQIGFWAASAFYLRSAKGGTVYELEYGSHGNRLSTITYGNANFDLNLEKAREGRAPISDLRDIFLLTDTPLQEIYENVNKHKGVAILENGAVLSEELSALFKRYITEPAVYLYVANNTKEEAVDAHGTSVGRTLSLQEFNGFLPEVLRSFLVALEVGYGVGENGRGENNDVNANDSGMVTNSHKLAAYESLKQLYDKWLTVYGPENFELKEYENAKSHRYLRHTTPSGRLNDDSEFDNFIYMDSFYRDISEDFYINPRSLYDTIRNHLNANSNYSVYELLYDIAQQNKMLFIALPVYSNYYDRAYLENIFKPNVMYDAKDCNIGNMGSTYILLYPHEVSHMTEEDADNGYLGFKNDGFRLDQDGINLDKTVAAILSTKDAEGDTDYVIPAFGVTYAKQNQSYFKNIMVNMNNPRVTDTSIANLFYLGNLGVNGDLVSPAAVGQDLYSVYSDRSYTCSVEMMGCMNIMPVMYFQLNNVPVFRGAYMITGVEHDFTPGKATTRFTGVRMSNKMLPFNEHVFNLKEFFDYMHVDMPAGMTTLYSPAGDVTGSTYAGAGSDADMGAIISGIESDDLKKIIYTASANVAYVKGNPKGWYKVRGMEPNYNVIKDPSYFFNKEIGNKTINTTVKGQCTSAPRTWYESAGIQLLWWKSAKTSTAQEAIDHFEKEGFKMIWHGGSADWKANKSELTKRLRPGDLCSQHYYKSKGAPSSHGCMYNGKEWLSDFKQDDMLAGQSFTDRQGEYSYCIWRYKAFWSDCN